MGTLKAISTTFLVLLSLLLNSRCCEGMLILVSFFTCYFSPCIFIQGKEYVTCVTLWPKVTCVSSTPTSSTQRRPTPQQKGRANTIAQLNGKNLWTFHVIVYYISKLKIWVSFFFKLVIFCPRRHFNPHC